MLVLAGCSHSKQRPVRRSVDPELAKLTKEQLFDRGEQQLLPECWIVLPSRTQLMTMPRRDALEPLPIGLLPVAFLVERIVGHSHRVVQSVACLAQSPPGRGPHGQDREDGARSPPNPSHGPIFPTQSATVQKGRNCPISIHQAGV